jgi:sulfite reductase beta subunit-like hemoprotein
LGRKLTIHEQPVPTPSLHDHLGVNRQREDGLSYIGIPVPVGIINTTQLHIIANIAEKYGKSNIRFTHQQNIILTDIGESSIPIILTQLSAAGLPVSTASRHGNTAICVGKTFCMKAITHTKEIALSLLNDIADPLLGAEVSFRISGCPNGCSGHAVADIALRGSSVNTETGSEERFDLLAGGGISKKPAFAQRIFSRLKPDELPAAISNLLQRYRAESEKGETFSEYAQRVLWSECR